MKISVSNKTVNKVNIKFNSEKKEQNRNETKMSAFNTSIHHSTGDTARQLK